MVRMDVTVQGKIFVKMDLDQDDDDRISETKVVDKVLSLEVNYGVQGKNFDKEGILNIVQDDLSQRS